jgi:beta-N-acetylhexosaminidase
MSRGQELSELCGQLIVSGLPGATLDAETARALSEKRRAGVILFKRNVESIDGVYALCKEIGAATASEHGPFIGVDQEGGRVVRLPAPAIQLPPMQKLGALGRPGLLRRAGVAVGAELLPMGLNLDFAPVLDVDSNPQNPVIGDRSFGSDAAVVGEMGSAFIDGLQARGVLACGKHYPGHGDTTQDSHLALPVVAHPRERLEEVELVPFRRAASLAGSFMTAHVVYEGLEPGVPATLSWRIATDLLRRELGFRNLLFSDDLEMRAVADRHGIEELAVMAVRAGCDVLLVCKDRDLADRAHAALVREADSNDEFFGRCMQAAERSRSARRRFPCRQAPSVAAMHQAIDSSGATGLLADLEKYFAAAEAGRTIPP